MAVSKLHEINSDSVNYDMIIILKMFSTKIRYAAAKSNHMHKYFTTSKLVDKLDDVDNTLGHQPRNKT